jgi:hypothetical protein
VKKPGLDVAAMDPDVIMSCITPSFGGSIPLEKESGPRRRAGEMPSCIATSYSSGDGVNLDMLATLLSWNMAGDASEKVEGEPIVPWVGHGLGNWPTRS